MKQMNTQRSLARSTLCALVILISACATQDSDRSNAQSARATSAIEETIVTLQALNAEFERAQQSRDAIAMAQAALERLEVVRDRFAEQDASLFIENTISMIQRAKIVAAGNEDMSGQLETLLEDIDLKQEQQHGTFGQLFGNTTNALKRKHSRSYEIPRESERLVRLTITDDVGVIVYVEAPFGRGVGLTLSDEADSVLCADASQHGTLICRHRPSHPGLVTAALSNPSPVELGVLMIANHPITED